MSVCQRLRRVILEIRVALIPKLDKDSTKTVKQTNTVEQYLMSLDAKVLSKMLANVIQCILKKLYSKTKWDFVQVCKISSTFKS